MGPNSAQDLPAEQITLIGWHGSVSVVLPLSSTGIFTTMNPGLTFWGSDVFTFQPVQDDLSTDEWRLVVKLKKLFEIP